MRRDLGAVRSTLVSEMTGHKLLAAIAAAKLEKLDLERENELLRSRIAEEDARLARA